MKKAMIFLLSCLLLTACDRGDEVKGWCVGKAHHPCPMRIQDLGNTKGYSSSRNVERMDC